MILFVILLIIKFSYCYKDCDEDDDDCDENYIKYEKYTNTITTFTTITEYPSPLPTSCMYQYPNNYGFNMIFQNNVFQSPKLQNCQKIRK